MNSTQRNLESIIGQNTPYFAHLQRACVCGLCTCGRCKCNAPKNLRIQMNDSCLCSDYQASFPGVSGVVRPQNFKQKEPLFQHRGGDMLTIYKHDYNGPNGAAFRALQEQTFVPSHETGKSDAGAPFGKNTTYGDNHIDFKVALPHLMFRPSQVPTTDPRLPFFGQVTNKVYGNFKPEDLIPTEDGRNFGQSQYKNPIAAGVQLPEWTNHREAYQPYGKVDPVRLYNPVGELELDNLPAFKNQFKSSASNHNGEQNPVCPARVILNQRKVVKLN